MRRIPKYTSEHNVYEQIAIYLQLQYPDVIYRFDIAADLKLTMGQAVKHKKLHPNRGYPDLFIAEPMSKYHGLYIEVKKEGEKLTKKDGSWRTPHITEQAEKIEKLRVKGYKAEFGIGFDECKKIIDEYLR